MEAVVPKVAPALERKEKNEKFGNAASFESVDKLLHRLSIKCHARVAKLGLPMEYDDVYQELCMSYIKAKNAWNPQGTSRFSTYCHTACMNNFNRSIEKMERDRVHLGMTRFGDMTSLQGKDGDFEDPTGFLAAAACDSSYSPDDRLNRAQSLTENLKSLSLNSRKLILEMLKGEQRSTQVTTLQPPKLREMALIAGIKGAELKRVKLEILNKFGVTW